MISQREAFEDWVTKRACFSKYSHMDRLLKRNGDGYATTWVDVAWMGWQAVESQYEPSGYKYKFADPISGRPVWRFDVGPWNGQKPAESKQLYQHKQAQE